MGKKGIKRLACLIACCLIFFGSMMEAAASNLEESSDEARLEGVSSNMPMMNIYCYPGDPDMMDSVEVSYGDEKLKVEKTLAYALADQGCDYYILLDISASSSAEYFAKMKESILDFWKNMQLKDKLTLVAFGDEVTMVFQDMTMADDITEKVNELENTDQNTKLFDAILRTANLADSKEEAGVRKVAVVFTDGEDFSENTSTKDEALAVLNEKRIPLYAMAAKEIYGKENTYLDSMGEFVRSSGGVMEVFDVESAVPKMQGLHKLFGEAYVIMAKAKTNVVDYQKKILKIDYSNDKTQTAEYAASHYMEDPLPPTASVRKTSEYALTVTFSESVRNAGDASSYEIELDDAKITDGYMVHYEEGDEVTAVLTFEEKLRNGKYVIRFHGISDNSMETNDLEKSCSVKVTSGVEPGMADYLKEYQAYVVGLIILLVLSAIAGIGWQVIKKRKGIITIEGKAVLQSNVEKKLHVDVQKKEASKKQISFYLDGAVAGKKQITVDVEKSIIVGRSQGCDVSINDEKMSRQHFAVYCRDGSFFIEDLHTTNGTIVNGRPLTAQAGLNNGDSIQVGDMTMTVRW